MFYHCTIFSLLSYIVLPLSAALTKLKLKNTMEKHLHPHRCKHRGCHSAKRRPTSGLPIHADAGPRSAYLLWLSKLCLELSQYKDTYHDTGKMCAITSCTVYLLVEYFKTTYAQKVAFVAYEFFSGLSMGAVGILRAYVAMASTESDRSRAVAITTMSIPLGILIGPVIQLLFTPIGYPGVTVFTGGHINMYTAPVIFALLCNIMALLLLIFYFKDKTTYKI
ncbi:hypothetical protein L596_021548 [Steinernema carpocapsae]|uniref:Major facilitator superfamily (MFS) profile domain-containing protein n=1 Tax=Steinernema carpocapsae TaxID=34508 RepID=A0A4U5MJ36_STECR|nr:hypothetical protein L596_021548 [Steinernema carpocapsae]